MSDEVNKNANSEAAKFRRLARARKEKAAALEQQLADAIRERDEARTETSTLKSTIENTPSAERERIAELESIIRGRTHRDAFDKLAVGKIRPDGLDAAYKLSGWAAETDEVDDESLAKTIDALVASNPFLAADAAKPDQGNSGSPPATRLSGLSGPVPGLGRGPAVKSSAENTPNIFRL